MKKTFLLFLICWGAFTIVSKAQVAAVPQAESAASVQKKSTKKHRKKKDKTPAPLPKDATPVIDRKSVV